MGVITWLKDFINGQYEKPKGIVGMYFGEKMVRQHQPETFWTIDLLKIGKDETILELGCGAGFAMKVLLEQSSSLNIIGLDYSPISINLATFRNRNAIKQKRARLVEGNAKELPFEKGSFTKVFSIQSIYFWDDLPKTFSEIYRVLRPEGTVTITLSNGKEGEVWEGVAEMVQRINPIMDQIGFKYVNTLQGPNSREFNTIAIIGQK